MKTKILSAALLSVLLTMPACTDLDEKLYDKVTTDDYGKTAAEIQTIVGGACLLYTSDAADE